MSSYDTKNKINQLSFIGHWRSYQQRVLEELKQYLNDKKLNIVAAPGAGKTTLGIEVMRLLANPTLIIAPTLTIRNQWKTRISQTFLQDKAETNQIISTDVRELKTINITTYQLIHSILSKDKNSGKFITNLIKTGIKTIVLDEAHHLRTEWYKSLVKLLDMLDKESEVVTVSLTGTPPYDVSATEWSNYHRLCGPVDAEISIPELVKTGDLCPHQDLIWFSKPEIEEKDLIDKFNTNKNKFLDYLKTDSDILYSIKSSSFIENINNNIEILYEDTDFSISIISYLLSCDDLDTDAHSLTKFLAISKSEIPEFDTHQAEILINGILGKFENYFRNIVTIKGKLKELELLESARKVNFTENINIKKIFAKSKSKLYSIKEITKIEHSTLKDNLREVILLDYIGQNGKSSINIMSTFNILKKEYEKLGILSGSLVVIPKHAELACKVIIERLGHDKNSVLMTQFDENYSRVETYGSLNIVEIVSELFYQGEINILIGTQSLLGEGWDSPCINSLIIASIAGSFMLSNQMRGRAIRIDPNIPDKISNIWHLATISENVNSPDMETISRRFNTFEGISFIDNTIQCGLNRIGYNMEDIQTCNCPKLNQISMKHAKDRILIKEKWEQTFNKSIVTEKNLAPQVYDVVISKKVQLPAIALKYQKLSFVQKFVIPFIMRHKTKIYQHKQEILYNAVIKTLCELNIIKTQLENIKIKTFMTDDFIPYCTVIGCSNYERKLFIESISELFSKPINHRYILKKEIYKGKNKSIKVKYYTVPEIIGINNKNVKIFTQNLEEYFGYLSIIYTRFPEGRKELVRAKLCNDIDNSAKISRIWI